MENQNYKSGFVAIIGRPNAGKSTLLNHLLGQKVAIVSDKPQTTRNQIRGILTTDEMQAIFIDTPGIHKPKHKLNQRMMTAVNDGLDGADLILYLVDITEEFGKGAQYIIDNLAKLDKPFFLILNKIDLLTKEQILPQIAFYAQKLNPAEVVPLSAAKGDNCAILTKLLAEYLPQGPQYYPDDMISDQPEQLLLSELIREQVLHITEQEVPHSIAVNIAAMEERASGLLYIEANIYVERESQKGIVIGQKGAVLQKIGSKSRREMEHILGCPVYLELRVKTKRDWRNNERLLKDWDLQE